MTARFLIGLFWGCDAKPTDTVHGLGSGRRAMSRDDRRMRFCRVLVGSLLLFGLSGCGKGPYPVQGKVEFKGEEEIKPLVGGRVVFEPMDPDMRTSSQGEIQADGTFRLSTFGANDGAM